MTLIYIIAALLAVPLVVAIVVVMMFMNLWIQAKASGVPVSFLQMVLMRLRRVNPYDVIGCLIQMGKAGLEVGIDDAETHVLAGGDLLAVTDAYIRAAKADLDIDFQRLAAIELAGRDVSDAVQTHVNPKVLICPVGGGVISGVCQDGIRLTASARVTVRTRLDRLVGGAGEETIAARVGEGIVAAIGAAETHQLILEKPERISQYILSRGLDSGTCFEILSVDIGNVDVHDNIGARLQSEQAGADKRVAQARAEVRRTAAVAAHKEMEAKTTEMQSRVTAARSVVPRAASTAFCEHNLGSRSQFAPNVHDRQRWRIAAD